MKHRECRRDEEGSGRFPPMLVISLMQGGR